MHQLQIKFCKQLEKLFQKFSTEKMEAKAKFSCYVRSATKRKCKKTYGSLYLIQVHLQNKHNIAEATQGTYQCPVCPQRFSDKKQMVRHSMAVHYKLKQRYTLTRHCGFCEESFKEVSENQKHWPHKSEVITNYACVVTLECGYKTTDLDDISAHVKNHDFDKLFVGKILRVKHQCPRCPYVSDRDENFKRHMKTCKKNVEKKVFICDQCQRCYTNSNSLRVHKKGPCLKKQMPNSRTYSEFPAQQQTKVPAVAFEAESVDDLVLEQDTDATAPPAEEILCWGESLGVSPAVTEGRFSTEALHSKLNKIELELENLISKYGIQL